MRSMLIRLLMVLGMLSGVGQGWAITVYQKGDLENADVTYHVYNGTLKLNGKFDHSGGQTRNAAFWFIGPKDKVEECDNKTDVGALLYSGGRHRYTNGQDNNKAAGPAIANNADHDISLNDIFSSCGELSSGFTWLEWGETDYWLDNPFYDLKIGLDSVGIAVSEDMLKDFPNAPREAVWHIGKEYIVRFWGSKAAGAGDVRDHADRYIVYKGKPTLKDTNDQSAKTLSYLRFAVGPGDLEDYSLKECSLNVYHVVNGQNGIADKQVIRKINRFSDVDEKTGQHTVDIGIDDNFKEGETYGVDIECGLTLKSHVIMSDPGTVKLWHEYIVGPQRTIEKINSVLVYRPQIIELNGHFRIDKKINIEGLILDPADVLSLEYRVNGGNWTKTTGETWGKDSEGKACKECFLLTLPDTFSTNAAIPRIEVKPTSYVSTKDKGNVPVEGKEVMAKFELNAFITPYFLTHDKYPIISNNSCGTLNLADRNTEEIWLKLAVSHQVDGMQGKLILPYYFHVISDGIKAIFSETNKGLGVATANNDIVFDTSNASTGTVNFSAKLLKEGDYYISVPVSFNKYEFEGEIEIELEINPSKSELMNQKQSIKAAVCPRYNGS